MTRTTPYLELDLSEVENNYRMLSKALPGVKLHYAMKCNPEPEVLKHLHSIGGRFEVASYPEVEMLMEIGVKLEEVLFSNPVKTVEHIAAAHKAGIRKYAFDSLDELKKLAEFAPGTDVIVRLRVEDFGTDVPSEGKFGISVDQAIRLMLAARKMGLIPYGAAFHVGCQMLHADAWENAIKSCARLMEKLEKEDIKLKLIDIGGGLPVAYADVTPDIPSLGRGIMTAISRHLPYTVEIAAEPGRALVASAGVMVSTVIGLAERDGKHWVHLDVGAFNGMMEALESQNKLLFPVSTDRKGRLIPTNLTGPSCDSQDTVLFDAPLPEDLKSGDRVYIHSAGAYTTSYASNFNGFDIPSVHCSKSTSSRDK